MTKNLEKCSCLQINKSALIKQMSLFDNALSHYRTLKVFIQNEKKITFGQQGGQKETGCELQILLRSILPQYYFYEYNFH